jgi:hypothetical protein
MFGYAPQKFLEAYTACPATASVSPAGMQQTLQYLQLKHGTPHGLINITDAPVFCSPKQ